MIGLLADRIVDVPLTNTGERALHCSRRHMHPGFSLLRSEAYRCLLTAHTCSLQGGMAWLHQRHRRKAPGRGLARAAGWAGGSGRLGPVVRQVRPMLHRCACLLS